MILIRQGQRPFMSTRSRSVAVKYSLNYVPKVSLSSKSNDSTNKSAIESSKDRRETDLRILRELGKHLWPDKSHPNSFALKSRVVAAVSLLVASKVINIQVPFLFKALVDSFQVDHTLLSSNLGDPLLLATPLAIVMGYGIARASSSLAAECRSAVFAPVAHDAIRQGKIKDVGAFGTSNLRNT